MLFIITCGKCGNEAKLTQKQQCVEPKEYETHKTLKHIKKTIESTNEEIELYITDIDELPSITCKKCGNTVGEGIQLFKK